jgi:hypothetical protein
MDGEMDGRQRAAEYDQLHCTAQHASTVAGGVPWAARLVRLLFAVQCVVGACWALSVGTLRTWRLQPFPTLDGKVRKPPSSALLLYFFKKKDFRRM